MDHEFSLSVGFCRGEDGLYYVTVNNQMVGKGTENRGLTVFRARWFNRAKQDILNIISEELCGDKR